MFFSFFTDMDLSKDGVAIVPIFNKEQTQGHRKNIQDIFFPEFLNQQPPYVMGGFGAYGNPSSFHHPHIRQLRQDAYPVMKEFFQKTFQGKTCFLEQMFDRVCVRRAGTSTSKETWHRDVCPRVVDPNQEHVFGGWINLDDEPQYFSCSLSTHRAGCGSKTGFVAQSTPTSKADRVKIPSGCAIVFYQNILHQVLPKKQKKDSFRLFQAFRVIVSDTQPDPLYPRKMTNKWISDQAVPLLPSDQHPPMYSSNHSSVFLFSNGPNDPIVFSKNCHPSCLISKTCNSGKNKGKTYQIVQRHMTSLRDYNIPLFPTYTKQEKQIFSPQEI